MTFGEYWRYFLLLIFAPRSLKTMEWRMLRLLNKDRRKHGLNSLRMQQDLREVARKHSYDMAKKDYFAHVNPLSQSPSDRLKLAGVSEVVSGENLAKIRGFKNATQVAEKGLMESPGHRANILQELYNTVGIGVIQSDTQIYYFTQNFAKRVLFLKKGFKKSIRLRSGLHLKGGVFAHAKRILWQVSFVKEPKLVNQQFIMLQDSFFDFWIHFTSRGLYEVRLFVDEDGKGNFILSNLFEVKVRKGFFD